jgi:hypothetical protein
VYVILDSVDQAGEKSREEMISITNANFASWGVPKIRRSVMACPSPFSYQRSRRTVPFDLAKRYDDVNDVHQFFRED